MLSRKLYIALFYIRQHRVIASFLVLSFVALTSFAVWRTIDSQPALAQTDVDLVTTPSQPVQDLPVQERPAEVPGRVYQKGPLPKAFSSCVEYEVINQWDNGFIADVTVVNNTNSPLDEWQISWNYADGQTIQNVWNAQLAVTEASSSMSLKNVPWNGSIEPDASVTFGFQGTYSGENSIPADFALNGKTCEDLEKSAIKKTQSQQPTSGVLQKIASCSVEYTIQSERFEDFSADVSITAQAAEPINDWRIEMQLDSDQQLISLWDGNAWQDGQKITVLPVSFNKELDTAPLTFGFTLNGSAMPQNITMNGTQCQVTETAQTTEEDVLE